MTKNSRQAYWAWLLAMALAGLTGQAHAQKSTPATSSSSLMAAIDHRLIDAPVVRGDFEQTKTVKGFKRPLLSHGHFLMAKDQGIQWFTTAPFASTLIVTREHLITKNGDSVQQMDTRTEPVLRAINDLLMAVLTGDMTALDLRFHVNGTLNNKGKWQITLTPKDKEISLFIARIDMEGADFVERIFLQEKSGDESRIEFMRHSQSHRLNPAESKLFN
jgi:Outer membrane lipoprotein carrier protein LolA